jgi:hypothetical protein
MSEQGMVTDRLVRVIQVIQLSQGSGLLTAWRGEGEVVEEGTIVFVRGQITEAEAGRRKGQAALNWLTTWGKCRYSFTPSAVDEYTKQLLARLAAGIDQGEKTSTVRAQPPVPPSSERLSGPSPWALPDNRPSEQSTAAGASPYLQIPYALRPFDQALRLIELNGFSRIHRHLLLLIDGKRTVLELARLVGRSPQEIGQALDDLERIGLIRRGGING